VNSTTAAPASSKRARAIQMRGMTMTVEKISEILQVPVKTINEWFAEEVSMDNKTKAAQNESVVDFSAKLKALYSGSSNLHEQQLVAIIENATVCLASINDTPLFYSKIQSLGKNAKELAGSVKLTDEQIIVQKQKRDSFLKIARTMQSLGKVQEAEDWVRKAAAEWELSTDQKRSLKGLKISE
jgi:hypothetical protein